MSSRSDVMSLIDQFNARLSTDAIGSGGPAFAGMPRQLLSLLLQLLLLLLLQL